MEIDPLRALLTVTFLAALALPQVAEAEVLSEADRELYRTAFAAAEGRKYDAALAATRVAEDPLPRAVLQWLRLKDPATDASFGEIADFVEGHPGWPGGWSLGRAAEAAMPLTLPPSQILSWFSKHPPVTPEGKARHATALLDVGRVEEAVALAREAWRTESFPRNVELAFHERFRRYFDQADERARFETMTYEGRSGPALRQAKRLGPSFAELATARLKLAEREPGVDAAIDRVPAALKDNEGLIFERARWRMRADRFADALELVDPVPVEVEHPERWWDLRHWMARRALRLGEISVAYRLAARNGLSEGVEFAEAEFLAGWIALDWLRDPGMAFPHFERLHAGVSSPISLSRGAYWAGQAKAAAGDRAAAEHWWRQAAIHGETFYGQMAATRLGGAPDVVANPEPRIPEERRRIFETLEVPQVILRLDELGEDHLVYQFFAALRSDAEDPVDWRLIADFAERLERPDQRVWTAKLARNDGHLLEAHLFPMLDGIDLGPPEEAALVLGLMRQESSFWTKAVSHAGARGLMQLMPATAKTTAGKLGLNYDLSRLTDDPEFNVTLGRVFLIDMVARYDGYLPLALAAYNAGPSRANSWIQEYGDPRDPAVDPIMWIESIPFSETRNYVQRVLESAVVYRQKLGLPPKPLPEVFRLARTLLTD
jgi:soluble lytic murein transglycosylase